MPKKPSEIFSIAFIALIVVSLIVWVDPANTAWNERIDTALAKKLDAIENPAIRQFVEAKWPNYCGSGVGFRSPDSMPEGEVASIVQKQLSSCANQFLLKANDLAEVNRRNDILRIMDLSPFSDRTEDIDSSPLSSLND